jgi:hypothetical protein
MAIKAKPDEYHNVTPYMIVAGADRLIDWRTATRRIRRRSQPVGRLCASLSTSSKATACRASATRSATSFGSLHMSRMSRARRWHAVPRSWRRVERRRAQPLPQRTLGAAGLSVSAVCFGAMSIAPGIYGDVDEASTLRRGSSPWRGFCTRVRTLCPSPGRGSGRTSSSTSRPRRSSLTPVTLPRSKRLWPPTQSRVAAGA